MNKFILVGLVSGLLPLYAAEPLREGGAVPDVAVRTADGEEVRLRDLTGAQPSVLIFYRGGWCPYCTRHLAALAEVEESVEALGYQILAISPDRPAKLAEAAKDAVFNYRLLSDSAMSAARGFGLAFQVDNATLELYKEYGIDLVDASGETHHLLPVPAVYIVDTKHRIRFAHIDPDYRKRLDPEAVLTAARLAMD